MEEKVSESEKREQEMKMKLRELEIQNEVLHSALQELSVKRIDQ